MFRKKDGERKRTKYQPQNFRSERGKTNSSHDCGKERNNQNSQSSSRSNNRNAPRYNICEKNNHDTKDCWFKQWTQCGNSDHLEIDCQPKQKNEANFSEESNAHSQEEEDT